MKKLLIIQFRTNTKTLAEEQTAFMKVLNTSTVTVSFKNAFLDNLDWNFPEEILEDACGVILGGSGEFDFDGGRELFDEKKTASHALVISMQPFLKYLEICDFPTLAICFGHQIIAQSLGVQVVNDKSQAKVGSHTVSLTGVAQSDTLFKGLPNTFIAQYGHKDSLSVLPTGATLLAQGEQCKYSAIRFGRKRYSVQFHPELDARDVQQKFLSHPDYLPEGMTPEELIQESPYATQLLRNFINNIL